MTPMPQAKRRAIGPTRIDRYSSQAKATRKAMGATTAQLKSLGKLSNMPATKGARHKPRKERTLQGTSAPKSSQTEEQEEVETTPT